MACSFEHEGVFSRSLSRITVVKDDKIGFDYPITCRFCETCDAINACPVNALSREGNGSIKIDYTRCTRCGICVSACPYNAIKLAPDKGPIICDLCGGNPACVKRCPTNALAFVDAVDMTLEEAKEQYLIILRRLGAHV